MQFSISPDLGSAVLGHGSIIILPEIIIILDINGPKISSTYVLELYFERPLTLTSDFDCV